jgi:hypothetical protein
LAGVVLLLLSGVAQAQCEGMVVIVRNSVYSINGLDAFCQEFNQMKTDLASLKSALSSARQENAMLRSRMTVGSVRSQEDSVALLEPVEQNPETASSAH